MLKIERKKRILARFFQGKKIPPYVYRLDRRTPDEIRQAGGFYPRNMNGNITLIEHVTRTFQSGPNKGEMTNSFSQWVSTGSYRMFRPIDGVFAQDIRAFWLYQIDAEAAMESGEFVDVNDHFDRAGVQRLYASQREWIKFGGISSGAIKKYMHGGDLLTQMNGPYAPEEAAVAGWNNF